MEEKMKTDEELMKELAEGNTVAGEEIFQRYKKKMFNYALTGHKGLIGTFFASLIYEKKIKKMKVIRQFSE